MSLRLRIIWLVYLRSGFAASRQLGVGYQTVEPFGRPGPVRGRQLERGADRRIPELKPEPDISGSLLRFENAEQALRREQAGREGITGRLRAWFWLRRLGLLH